MKKTTLTNGNNNNNNGRKAISVLRTTLKGKRIKVVAVGTSWEEVCSTLELAEVVEEHVVSYYGERRIGTTFRDKGGKIYTYYTGFYSQVGLSRDRYTHSTSVLVRGKSLVKYSDLVRWAVKGFNDIMAAANQVEHDGQGTWF